MIERADHFIRFVDELARLRGRVAILFDSIRSADGLTEVENIVLTAVAGARRPPTVPQIGRSLGHARQVIQRAADALAARGLVKWCDNPDHKRARLLVPTASGTALKKAQDAQGLELAEQVTRGIDPARLAQAVLTLHDIREQLETNLRAQGADSGEGLYADEG